MKRKQLTPEQYIRANRVVMMTLTVAMIIFMVAELDDLLQGSISMARGLRAGLYALSIIAINIVARIKPDKKFTMIFMAVIAIIMYGLLVFGNGPGCMVMAFPIVISCMVYLNTRLVVAGTVISFIIDVARTALYKSAGDIDAFNQANMTVMGIIIAIYGCIVVTNLLIKFSKEDQEVIEEKARKQEQIAITVSGIVKELEKDFTEVLSELNDINESMYEASSAIDNIAGSSESTAEAANNQANMTGQIQTSLESTNQTAEEARTTTEKLSDTIEKGKGLSGELHKQSVLVDKNTQRISNTVEELVKNVESVSNITASILNISSQTNLLALNASIEAARAGEAGKGFAVVADEIRKLAEETRVSTEKITEIINELTEVTNQTKEGIEESVESINVQREKVEQVNASFIEIGAGMQELHTNVESMSEEVDDVLRANTAIVDSISMLSATSEEVSASAQVSKQTFENISHSMEIFSKAVDGTFEQLKELEKAVKGE